VNHPSTNGPTKGRIKEAVYPGKSPWKDCFKFLFLAAAVGLLAWQLASSEDIRRWLKVEETAIRWGAGLAGGGAATLLVVGAWTWIGRLQWVAVSPAGIRWYSGRRIRCRQWEEYIRVHRSAIQMSVFGEELRAGQFAEVEFRYGRPLRISPETVHGYEDVIAEIQAGSVTASHRAFAPAVAGTRNDPGSATFGPLEFDSDGLVWEGTHRRWDEIENYEVAIGYLRIQPVGGAEFFRRLSEMGDWQKAVARLDAQIGNRRVGRPSVAVR
jgi:hypothetical protein